MTRPTTTLPPDCEDSLSSCDELTTPPDTCYPVSQRLTFNCPDSEKFLPSFLRFLQEGSSFISNGCCATCFAKRRNDLPPGCTWGNRGGYCDAVATEERCEDDPQLAVCQNHKFIRFLIASLNASVTIVAL